jgi:putative addiction module component (TIGR02574 family)
MATILEVEKLAFDLPETQRAVLASHLLSSLPSVLHDEDEGIAEALRRDAELDATPGTAITLEELDESVRARRQ